MPEGPELHLAARFVNKTCFQRVFGGKVVKSEVSTRNPDVDWDEEAYTISAKARGKEVKLTLSAKDKSMDLMFRFGMSGKFAFGPISDMQKHSHLSFFTKKNQQVLSFVDYRRFGKWEPHGNWGADRGPCVMTEYEAFRLVYACTLVTKMTALSTCEHSECVRKQTEQSYL
jgi:endonuclease VIII-like 1